MISRAISTGARSTRLALGEPSVNMDPNADTNHSQNISEFDFEMDLPQEILQILTQGKSFEVHCTPLIDFVIRNGHTSSVLTAIRGSMRVRVCGAENSEITTILAIFVLNMRIFACLCR